MWIVAAMQGRGTQGGTHFHCVSPHFPMSPPASGILLHFHLSIAPAPIAAELPTLTTPPLEMCLDLGIGCQACRSEEASENRDTHLSDSADMHATSCRVRSFTHDWENKIYLLQWEDLSSFHMWHWEEELAHSIELITSSTVSGGHLWLQKCVYVCVRQLSSGSNKYNKKFSHCFQKISTKKTGCHCQIVIKHYHSMPMVLGRYISRHDHDLSLSNIAYMCLSHMAWETVKTMLIQQIDRRAIVHNHWEFTFNNLIWNRSMM